MRHPGQHRDRNTYTDRLLYSAVGALLLLIALFRFWPDIKPGDKPMVFDSDGPKEIVIDMIEQTVQVAKPPPPPAPLPPIEIPNDELVEEIIEIEDEIDIDTGEEVSDAPVAEDAPVNTGPRIVENAEQGPRPVSIAEPEYPREAKRKGIRARVVVEFLISEKGRVESVEVSESFLLKKNGQIDKSVPTIGFGIEEAVLAAARKWRFRPAREGGKPVATYYDSEFTLGI